MSALMWIAIFGAGAVVGILAGFVIMFALVQSMAKEGMRR